jgi:hypothetical protein
MSKTRRQVIAAMFASAAIGLSAPEKPNFSGRWRLDPSRSSKDAPADLAETIDHREPVIRIDTAWDRTRPAGVSNGAILAPAVQLKSDGTESSNDVPMGLSVVTKSHWDGDKLVTEWRLNGLDVPLSGTWTRYLTGPTAMVVDSVAESNGRRLTARYVFAK